MSKRDTSVLKKTVPTWIAACESCVWHKTSSTVKEALAALTEHLDWQHNRKYDERDHFIFYSDGRARLVLAPALMFDSLKGDP